MRIGFWVQLLLILIDFCVFLTPTECFTIPISVSTGMAIIMALVKVKAVIVKVLLGLKAMGYETFVLRTRKRRSPQAAFGKNQDELLTAWKDLESTVGKLIEFDLESCLDASKSSTKLQSNKPLVKSPRMNSDKAYSTWVSKVLGSIINDPNGCHILNDELKKPVIDSIS